MRWRVYKKAGDKFEEEEFDDGILIEGDGPSSFAQVIDHCEKGYLPKFEYIGKSDPPSR